MQIFEPRKLNAFCISMDALRFVVYFDAVANISLGHFAVDLVLSSIRLPSVSVESSQRRLRHISFRRGSRSDLVSVLLVRTANRGSCNGSHDSDGRSLITSDFGAKHSTMIANLMTNSEHCDQAFS